MWVWANFAIFNFWNFFKFFFWKIRLKNNTKQCMLNLLIKVIRYVLVLSQYLQLSLVHNDLLQPCCKTKKLYSEFVHIKERDSWFVLPKPITHTISYWIADGSRICLFPIDTTKLCVVCLFKDLHIRQLDGNYLQLRHLTISTFYSL